MKWIGHFWVVLWKCRWNRRSHMLNYNSNTHTHTHDGESITNLMSSSIITHLAYYDAIKTVNTLLFSFNLNKNIIYSWKFMSCRVHFVEVIVYRLNNGRIVIAKKCAKSAKLISVEKWFLPQMINENERISKRKIH